MMDEIKFKRIPYGSWAFNPETGSIDGVITIKRMTKEDFKKKYPEPSRPPEHKPNYGAYAEHDLEYNCKQAKKC